MLHYLRGSCVYVCVCVSECVCVCTCVCVRPVCTSVSTLLACCVEASRQGVHQVSIKYDNSKITRLPGEGKVK